MPPRRIDPRVDLSASVPPFDYKQGLEDGRQASELQMLKDRVAALEARDRPVKKPLLESLEEAIGFKTLLLVVLVCTALIFASCAAYKIGGERLVQLVIEARKGGG